MTSTATTPARFYAPTMAHIMARNAAIGHHFFAPSTLRFFKSRILDQVFSGPGGTYFVTSERHGHDAPRLYTVRQAHRGGQVDTVHDYQRFNTAATAKRWARKAADLPAVPFALGAPVRAAGDLFGTLDRITHTADDTGRLVIIIDYRTGDPVTVGADDLEPCTGCECGNPFTLCHPDA